jgi:hypothetical protein
MTLGADDIERNYMLDMLDMLYVPHVNSELYEPDVSSTLLAAYEEQVSELKTHQQAMQANLNALNKGLENIANASLGAKKTEADAENTQTELMRVRGQKQEFEHALRELREKFQILTAELLKVRNNYEQESEQRIRVAALASNMESAPVAENFNSLTEQQTNVLHAVMTWVETSISSEHLTNEDVAMALEDINAFFNVKQIGTTLELTAPTEVFGYDVATESGKIGKQLFARVLEAMTQKAGKVRMVVRFNNMSINVNKTGKSLPWVESYQRHNMLAAYTSNGNIDKDDDENFLFVERANKETNSVNKGYKVIRSKDSSKRSSMQVKLPAHDTRRLREIKMQGSVPQQLKMPLLRELKFEQIFTTESQSEVYESLSPFIFSAFESQAPLGIFAYGGTGSGKTYTMLGDSTGDPTADEGIVGRLIKAIESNLEIETASLQAVEIVPGATEFDGGGKQSQRVPETKTKIFDLVELSYHEKFKYPAPGLVSGGDKPRSHNYYRLLNDKDLEPWVFTSSKKFGQDTWANPQLDDGAVKKNLIPVNGHTFMEKSLKDSNAAKIAYTIMSNRKTVKTKGNPYGSSRSHVVFTFTLTKQDKSMAKIFLIDLAGRESEEVKDKSILAMSMGINYSLLALTKTIIAKKCKGKVDMKAKIFETWEKCSTCPTEKDADSNERSDPVKNKMLNSHSILGTKIGENPLMAMTSKLWTDENSKIMLIACMYPFAQGEIGTVFQPSSWNRHADIDIKNGEESMDTKYQRDLNILNELDYAQAVIQLKPKQV